MLLGNRLKRETFNWMMNLVTYREYRNISIILIQCPINDDDSFKDSMMNSFEWRIASFKCWFKNWFFLWFKPRIWSLQKYCVISKNVMNHCVFGRNVPFYFKMMQWWPNFSVILHTRKKRATHCTETMNETGKNKSIIPTPKWDIICLAN